MLRPPHGDPREEVALNVLQTVVTPPDRDMEDVRVNLLHCLDSLNLQDNTTSGFQVDSLIGEGGDVVIRGAVILEDGNVLRILALDKHCLQDHLRI